MGAGLQPRDLIGRGLLDLTQQVRFAERGGRVAERGAGLLIGRIGEPGAAAGASLHDNLHTPLYKSGHAIWDERDAVFAGGAFLGNSDDHGDWKGEERGVTAVSHKVRVAADIGKRRSPW